jgi:hypothetical protein
LKLSDELNPYPKSKQLYKVKVKLSQRQLGDISANVRAEVKIRSGGQCEIRKKCTGAQGVHMAHLTTRSKLTSRTTANDLKHSCVACHLYLDGEGISYRNELRDAK